MKSKSDISFNMDSNSSKPPTTFFSWREAWIGNKTGIFNAHADEAKDWDKAVETLNAYFISQVNTAYEEYNACGGIYLVLKIAQPKTKDVIRIRTTRQVIFP